MIVLCNPSNPTGGVYQDGDIKAVAALALKNDIFIISDETYDYLLYDRKLPVSPAQLPELAGRTIVINSFSKKYALTGWRVGYAAAPRPIMDQLMKILDATAICAPTPGQIAALAALNGPQEPFLNMVRELEKRRALVMKRLDDLAEWFEYVPPAGAFYLLAGYRFSTAPSYDLAVRMIREARVITIPGGTFGPGGEGRLRLSFGGEENELEEAFDRLEKWVKA